MFGLRADRHLFLMVAVAVWVTIASGTTYCFPLLSPALSGHLRFTPSQVNAVSTTGAVVSYLSLPFGVLYDRRGTKWTLLSAAALSVVGYAVLALVFFDLLPSSVVLIAVFYAVSQLASPCFDTGTVLTLLGSLSQHQGRVVIIQKTFMGLGSSVVSSVYSGFFSALPLQWYLVGLGGFAAAVGAAGAAVIRDTTRHPELRVVGLNTEAPDVDGADDNAGARSARRTPSFVATPHSTEHAGFFLAEESDVVCSSSSVKLTNVDPAPFLNPSTPTPPTQSIPAQVPTTTTNATTPSTDDVNGTCAKPNGSDTRATSDTVSANVGQYTGDSPIDELSAVFHTPSRYTLPFRFGVALLLASIGFIVGTDIVRAVVTLSHTARAVLAAVTLLLCAGFFIMPCLAPSTPPLIDTRSLQPPLQGADDGQSSSGSISSLDSAPTEPSPYSAAVNHRHGVDTDTARRPESSFVPVRLSEPLLRSDDAEVTCTHSRPSRDVSDSSESTISVVSVFEDMDPQAQWERRHRRQNTKTVWRNMLTVDLWLLWVFNFAIAGSTGCVNANATFLYRAVADGAPFDASRNAVYLSMFGAASAVGHVVVGFAHPWLTSRRMEIWTLLPLAPFVCLVGSVLFLIVPIKALGLPFFLMGLGAGLGWATGVLVCKRVFTQVGQHYNFYYSAGAPTPLLFNSWMFAHYYEHVSREQHRASLTECEGVACILLPMLVLAAVSAVGCAAAVALAVRLQRGRLVGRPVAKTQ